MYMVKLTAEDGTKVLVNPVDIRWIKEYTKDDKTGCIIEFFNDEQMSVLCESFDDIEQKILDATLQELNVTATDGIPLYVENKK